MSYDKYVYQLIKKKIFIKNALMILIHENKRKKKRFILTFLCFFLLH